MHRPIPVSSGIRLHLDNLLLYSFSFTLDFFFFKSTVVSPHSNLNEELLNYQLCIIVRYDIDSDVCVKRAWEPLQWSCMYSIIYVYHHKNIIYFCISNKHFFLFVSIFIKVSDIQTQIRPTEESVSNSKAMSHTERHIATPCPCQRLCLSFALPCMQHSMRSIYTQTGTCRPVPANIKPTNLNTNLRFDP